MNVKERLLMFLSSILAFLPFFKDNSATNEDITAEIQPENAPMNSLYDYLSFMLGTWYLWGGPGWSVMVSGDLKTAQKIGVD